MSDTINRFLGAFRRRIVAELERLSSKETKRKVDVHALDDWTPDLLAVHQGLSHHSGNAYSELWRRFSEYHLAGKPELANAARATGIRLTERLAKYHAELQADFPEGFLRHGDISNHLTD